MGPSKKIIRQGSPRDDIDPFEVRRVQILDEIEFALLEIEHNNSDFFQGRKSDRHWEVADRIFDHVWFFTSRKEIMVHIHSGSDLPGSIQQEVLAAFQIIRQRYKD